MRTAFDTHEVLNQAPPFVDVNLFAADRPLRDAVNANGAHTEIAALERFGEGWGTAHMFEQARLANENPPKLRTFDPNGRRLDIVEFHPAYHRFMGESIGDGLAAMTWDEHGARAGAPNEVARAARYYMVAQVENGHMCPVTMTRAAVAALAAAPALLESVVPKIN
jgi:putative acyl-CoA dehydrogenase